MLASALTPYYGRTLAVRILQTRYVTEIRAVRMCYRSLQATRTGGARHAHRIGPIPRSMPGGYSRQISDGIRNRFAENPGLGRACVRRPGGALLRKPGGRRAAPLTPRVLDCWPVVISCGRRHRNYGRRRRNYGPHRRNFGRRRSYEHRRRSYDFPLRSIPAPKIAAQTEMMAGIDSCAWSSVPRNPGNFGSSAPRNDNLARQHGFRTGR